MSISYGSELATDFSLKVRDTLQNEDLHHLLRTRIRQDKKRVDRWLTPQGGGLTAAGIGGPLTGRGADLLLIDDYIKNAEDSLSIPQLKKTWEWFKSTAFTRLEPGASLIILATRWNQADLIGRALRDMPHENWKVINLPALAEANDPLGRAPGEALWPERYSRERLLKIKEALGTYWWSAMYQQSPKASMAGQDLGDMLQVIGKEDLPDVTQCKRVRAWDLAATSDGGDYTAGPRMLYHKGTGDIIVDDLQHFQKSPYQTEQMIETCRDGDGHGVQVWMEQEPGSSGVTVIDHYKTDVFAGYSFDGEKATGPIEVRAGPFLAAVEAGRVKIVKAKWNQAMIDEINAFGENAEHDDIVVSLALGYNKLVKGLHGGLTWGREGDQRNNVVPIRRKANRPSVPKDGRLITGLTW
jgi:predicted phage terminase large subunit-like protein